MKRSVRLAAGLALLAGAVPATAAPGAAPQVVRPDESDAVQDAASVVTVDALHHQGELGAKLFGTAGGDPAMNGLYTYLAFFMPPPENGWRVFQLGDFLSYELVSEAPGRLVLLVHESVMNATGEIGARDRRLAVSWRVGPEAPATVTVATLD